MEFLKKENVLLIVILVCVILYWKGKQISDDQKVKEWIKFLPLVGGIAYGFNTLIQLAK